MYSEVEHPEIIPNKQSTNHNSPLDRIHGRMAYVKHGKSTNKFAMKKCYMYCEGFVVSKFLVFSISV